MKRMAYAFAAALVAGCTTAPAERPGTQAGQLEQVVESYFDATLEMNPVIATFIGDHRFNDQLPNMLDEEFLDRAAALERDYLERIRDIDASKLEGQDRITYDVFLLDREWGVEGERFPAHLIPINQFYGLHNFFAMLGSGQSAQPFATVKDYDNWLGRDDGFVVIMEQIEKHIAHGIAEGVTQPRLLTV